MDNKPDYHLAETEDALGADLEDFIVNYLVDQEVLPKKRAKMLYQLYQNNEPQAIAIIDGYVSRQWDEYIEDLAYARKADREVRFNMENLCS